MSDGVLVDGPHPATILFNAQPSEVWRHQYFSPAELADGTLEASLWGDLAHGDGGGRVTLIEYALGSDPRSPGDGDEGITVEHGADGLALTYRKYVDRTDIT